MNNLDEYDVSFMLHEAGRMLGRNYLYGAKWTLDSPSPEGPIDCSGFVRWVYSRGGISIPDGSSSMYSVTTEVSKPQIGDLGFFKDIKNVIDHVGIVYDDFLMIEARGNPYDEVIVRPRSKWEAYELFTGYRTYTRK